MSQAPTGEEREVRLRGGASIDGAPVAYVVVLAAVVASEQRYLSVAAVYLATTYTLTVTDQLWEITQVMRNYNRVMGDAHDMVEILAVAPAVADRTETPFERGPGAVEFDDVTFAHEGAGDSTSVAISLPVLRRFT